MARPDATESDEALVAAAVAGRAGAFEQLARRCAPIVYRLALRMTGDRGDAEEVLQETFLQLFRNLERFRGEAKFSTWLYRIALNAARMHLRSRKSRAAERPIEECLPPFDASGSYARLDVDYSCAARADQLLEQRELARVALELLSELPELYRAAFVLRDLEGLDTRQAAELLGVDVTVVRQRLHRARLMLRARLTELVGGEA